MFSYLVALLAIGLFLANPIGHYLFPPQGRSPSRHLAPKPRMNESLLALVGPEDAALDCPVDAYATRIISREPLVLYLEGFVSEPERKHLLEISEPLFEASTVTHKVDDVHRDTAVRNSSVALIPRTATVRCIEARARALQGWRDDVFLERLRTQRYVAGGHYAHHFDYGAAVGGWGRVSSFMVWLDTQDLQGGGTEFPYLAVRGEAAKPWCRLVECDTTAARPQPTGTVFKPLAGNAVYWENFAADGRGSDATWHAGLPVMEGVKVQSFNRLSHKPSLIGAAPQKPPTAFFGIFVLYFPLQGLVAAGYENDGFYPNHLVAHHVFLDNIELLIAPKPAKVPNKDENHKMYS